jgi:molybdopterin-guanine dinucleotide biosynthesis protein A
LQNGTEDRRISGVILAGGKGRRMGSVDKGLQQFKGRRLIEWVIDRLQPQVVEILINSNKNKERYSEYGYRVISDLVPDYAGPLAGFHSALSTAANELVLTVPCDSPFMPEDLAERLSPALAAASVDIAVARTGTQVHPVFCLLRRSLLPHLTRYLSQGGRKIDAWYADLNVVEVSFDDKPDAFANFNTLEELTAAEKDD